MIALKIAFWICLILVFYTYIGYGMLLWVLVNIKRLIYGKQKKRELPPDNELPEVTLMICASIQMTI